MMDKKSPCKECGINNNCICIDCLGFYKKLSINYTYSCMDLTMENGCNHYGRNISIDDYEGGCYHKLDWIDKIKYSKEIKDFQEKLK